MHPGSENLEVVISKINSLNGKSGPFDATLFLGEILLDLNKNSSVSDLQIQLPIYFASGHSSIISNDKLQSLQNFNYLGDYGVHTLSNGIKLAFVSGEESILNDNFDKIKLKLENKEVDLLITSQWPKAIAQEAKLFLGNSKIDQLLKLTRPKYHFAVGSSSGKFYERAPFQWDDGSITRFISLAKYGSKEKWIYAFNYNNARENEVKLQSKNLTPNPFEVLDVPEHSTDVELCYAPLEGEQEHAPKKRRTENNSISSKEQNDQEQPVLKRQSLTRKVVLPENCFFCLSNPKLESHMIISIGEHAYLTIAKGPLTRPSDRIKFSGHCLIIPISHTPKLDLSQKETPENASLLNELMRYEVSLVKFFASFNLGTIMFQINKSNSIHFHIQVFPIPVDFLSEFSKTLDKNAKLNNAKFSKNVNFDFKTYADECDPEYQKLVTSNKDYVSFTVFNKPVLDKTIYLSEIETLEKPLDLQFGRRVLAYLLQTPKRIKWDKCQQSTQKETAETEAFKEAFKDYDFTMDL